MTEKTSTPKQNRLLSFMVVILAACCSWLYYEVGQIKLELTSRMGISPVTPSVDPTVVALQSTRIESLENKLAALQEDWKQQQQVVESERESRKRLQETSLRVSSTPPTNERPLIEIQPQIKFEPKVSPPTFSSSPPPVARRSADLILKAVSVKSPSDGGSSWDQSGNPDLRVRVSCGGNSAVSSVAKDTYYSTFNERLLRVSVGDTLKITVLDKDVLDDDMIAVYSKEITNDTLNAGTASWSFDEVELLEVKFEP